MEPGTARLRQEAGALMRRRFTRMLSKTKAKKTLQVTPGLCEAFRLLQQTITRKIHCVAFPQVLALPTPAPTVASLRATCLRE